MGGRISLPWWWPDYETPHHQQWSHLFTKLMDILGRFHLASSGFATNTWTLELWTVKICCGYICFHINWKNPCGILADISDYINLHSVYTFKKLNKVSAEMLWEEVTICTLVAKNSKLPRSHGKRMEQSHTTPRLSPRGLLFHCCSVECAKDQVYEGSQGKIQWDGMGASTTHGGHRMSDQVGQRPLNDAQGDLAWK